MDFPSFLEGGLEDATFVARVPAGQQVPAVEDVDFASELEVLIDGATEQREAVNTSVGQPGAAGGTQRRSITGGDFSDIPSKRKKVDPPASKKGGAAKKGDAKVGTNGSKPKIKRPKIFEGIKLSEPPGDNYKLRGESEKSSLGPGKGKGLSVLRKLLPEYDPSLKEKLKEKENEKEVDMEMEMVDVSSSDDESVTGGGGYYAPDVRADDFLDIEAKGFEPPHIPDDGSPFTVTLPSVPLASDLLTGQERKDYIAGVVMPYRRRDMTGHTNSSFRDYANETVIRLLTVQAENLRRWQLADDSLERATRQNHAMKRQLCRYEENGNDIAMESKCEDLRTEILAEKTKNEMAEAAIETERLRYSALEAEKSVMEAEENEWKAKFESRNEMMEKLLLEAADFQDKEKAFQKKIHALEQEKKRLLEGLPSIVSKLHSSYEFAREMTAVQRKAMALGAHRNLERLKESNPRLDIKKLAGYHLEAMDELKAVGKDFQQKSYPYISALASGFELPVDELLQIAPAPFPEAARASSSALAGSAPAGSAALTS